MKFFSKALPKISGNKAGYLLGASAVAYTSF